MAELDFYYSYALHCNTFVVSHGTSFYNLMTDFIDQFFEKLDVINVLKPYMKLLTAKEDVEELRGKYQ